MKKIKAYTLMEVTIAMLLSALCIGICYTAYDIIGKYYLTFQQKNEKSTTVLLLKRAMDRDIAASTIVLQLDHGFTCQSDSAKVSYLFQDGYILRALEPLRTDTFKLAWKDMHIAFEGMPISESDTLDQISFSVQLNKQVEIPLVFIKHYSSQNLFR